MTAAEHGVTSVVQPVGGMSADPSNTISISAISMAADAPPNVATKPPLPAPETLTVPAKPAMPLMAAATLLFVIAVPPLPRSDESWPPIRTRNALPALAALKFVRTTVCTSLRPARACAIEVAS